MTSTRASFQPACVSCTCAKYVVQIFPVNAHTYNNGLSVFRKDVLNNQNLCQMFKEKFPVLFSYLVEMRTENCFQMVSMLIYKILQKELSLYNCA